MLCNFFSISVNTMFIASKISTTHQIIVIYSVDMDPHMFCKLGNRYTKSKMSSQKTALRRFKSFFGVTPKVCSISWNEIKNQAPPAAQPKHLLWCLSFLKEYSTEHHRRSIFEADEKTIRFWTWTFVKLLANLNVVSFIKILSFTFTLHKLPCADIFLRFIGIIDSMEQLMAKHAFVH